MWLKELRNKQQNWSLQPETCTIEAVGFQFGRWGVVIDLEWDSYCDRLIWPLGFNSGVQVRRKKKLARNEDPCEIPRSWTKVRRKKKSFGRPSPEENKSHVGPSPEEKKYKLIGLLRSLLRLCDLRVLLRID